MTITISVLSEDLPFGARVTGVTRERWVSMAFTPN